MSPGHVDSAVPSVSTRWSQAVVAGSRDEKSSTRQGKFLTQMMGASPFLGGACRRNIPLTLPMRLGSLDVSRSARKPRNWAAPGPRVLSTYFVASNELAASMREPAGNASPT